MKISRTREAGQPPAAQLTARGSRLPRRTAKRHPALHGGTLHLEPVWFYRQSRRDERVSLLEPPGIGNRPAAWAARASALQTSDEIPQRAGAVPPSVAPAEADGQAVNDSPVSHVASARLETLHWRQGRSCRSAALQVGLATFPSPHQENAMI